MCPTFRRNVSPPSSRSKISLAIHQHAATFKTLFDNINEVGIEVSAEKTKYVYFDASSPEYKAESYHEDSY
jgi:hypothetical protein